MDDCALRVASIALTIALASASPAHAQEWRDLLRRGDSLQVDPRAALAAYRDAEALAPERVDVLWRVVRAGVDVAKVTVARDRDAREQSDSIFALAQTIAERAIALDSLDANAHFALALTLGEQARTKGGRDRVRFGDLMYREAARALELDPRHHGAMHVLGAWHAEVRRLSRIERFFARTFLGADLLSIASRDSALVYLERAVEIGRAYVHHRLELAQILLDLDRNDDARVQLEAIRAIPDRNVMDPWYREEAERLLAEIDWEPEDPSGRRARLGRASCNAPTLLPPASPSSAPPAGAPPSPRRRAR